MLFSIERAFVGRDEIQAPLKTSAWKAKAVPDCGRKHITSDKRLKWAICIMMPIVQLPDHAECIRNLAIIVFNLLEFPNNLN